MRFKAVLFDLDGTLLDTLEDLADSMNTVLAQQNFPVHPVEAYRYFVGDGIKELARRVLPEARRDEATVAANVERMAAEYGKRWDSKTKPYPGMEDTLDGLTGAGVRLAVLSNKPDPFTKKMIPALLPRWVFDPVIGARPGVPVKPDPQTALEIATIMQLAPGQILYVGDTSIDMKTANAAGMYAVGAAWGFRSVDELIQTGAKVIAQTPGELLTLVKTVTGEVEA